MVQPCYNCCWGESFISIKKTLALTLAVVILITVLVTGIQLAVTAEQEDEQIDAASDTYIYSVSPYQGSGKIYLVTVETNWASQPKVSLPESGTSKYVSVVFGGWSTDTVFFNVTIPTDLLWGNISLVRKYCEQSPDLYTLSNNGTHNSIWMSCTFTPYFSGVGYFAIRGTEAAW
jgi:archaellum component FlaF (FlaF/FlaG flagellin family)